MALMDDGWEERMAARARERGTARGDLAVRESEAEHIARLRAEQIAEHPEWFSPEPPDDNHCSRCDEWRLENTSMGRYTWWTVCDFHSCTCACHPDPPGQRVALA